MQMAPMVLLLLLLLWLLLEAGVVGVPPQGQQLTIFQTSGGWDTGQMTLSGSQELA
jgi:hypothetical protein